MGFLKKRDISSCLCSGCLHETSKTKVYEHHRPQTNRQETKIPLRQQKTHKDICENFRMYRQYIYIVHVTRPKFLAYCYSIKFISELMSQSPLVLLYLMNKGYGPYKTCKTLYHCHLHSRDSVSSECFKAFYHLIFQSDLLLSIPRKLMYLTGAILCSNVL